MYKQQYQQHAQLQSTELQRHECVLTGRFQVVSVISIGCCTFRTKLEDTAGIAGIQGSSSVYFCCKISNDVLGRGMPES